MMKINKFLKLIPVLTIGCTTLPLVALTGCNKTTTYSITYGDTPGGLTYTTQPTSTKEKTEIIISYTIATGYYINANGCSVTCGKTDITSECTISSTQLTIPASCVTGNIVVTLATTTTPTSTYSVTYNTPTGLTWTTTVSNVASGSSLLMEYTLNNGYAIDATKCSITVGGTSIISQITWKNGKISIPSRYVTGDIVITIILKASASYSVSHDDTGILENSFAWLNVPTTCTAGTNYEATYELEDGYAINTATSSITSNGTDITSHCTYGNGTLIVDGNYITGNVVIKLVTITETDTAKAFDAQGEEITIERPAGVASQVYTLSADELSSNGVLNITLSGTWLNTSIKIASTGTYNITLADGFKLSNASSTSEDAEAPFDITKNATGAIVNFIIPNNAEATINDKRSNSISYGDDFVIRHNDKTAAGQLNFKGDSSGAGVLNINNLNNNKGCYAKAIQSKVNMTISGGVTINAFSYDTCIQCGGKLTIDNSNVLADSYYDDGIKTKFLDPDEDLKFISVNPNKNRDIIVKGNSQITVYSDMNGINAAHNFVTEADDNGTPTINVYTNTQANTVKTGSVAGTTSITEQNMFIEVPSSLINTYGIEDYFWTIDFFADNTSGEIQSTEYMTLKKIATTGQSSTNYFFKCDRPLSTDASYFKINLFAKAQYGKARSEMDATASSGYIQPYTTPTSTSVKDCLAISGISGTTISTSSSKFDRNYKYTEKGGGQGEQETIDTKIGSKGIKAKNNIALPDGTINIKSYDTSISCSYGDIYCNSATAGDVLFGAGTIQVSGATITTYSPNDAGDGIKAYGQLDISGGSISVTNAVEAIEAPLINVSGGKTVVYATDDGLNTSTSGKYQTSGLSFNMSGGILDVQTKSGDTDCIDSNNTITITGGLLVSRVPSSGSAMTLDWESGNVSVTGTATVVLLGKTEADGTNEINPEPPSSKTISTTGTDYTSSSSASTICASGNHTISYYSTTSTSSTDSYVYNNKTTMNSQKIRIWSCTGRVTIQ